MWGHVLEYSRTALLHGLSYLWERGLWGYQGNSDRLHKFSLEALETRGVAIHFKALPRVGFSYTSCFTAQIFSGLEQTEH